MNIIGGVCLLLWGLRAVRNGMTRAFGADLHRIVSKSTKNHLAAFFSGVGVTALLQSSTATAFIVAAFCGQGVMSLASGLAVILGADVGTSIVAQLLSFDVSWLAPLLITVGYIVFSTNKKKGKLEHIGKLVMGLALMLFALAWIKQSAIPLKESDVLAMVLHSLDKDPVMALMLAALLTWVAHSSLAIVLLLMSLVGSGVLPVEVGLVMVLGANLGGAFVPLFATLKDNREACRVPVGNMLMRMTGILFILPFIGVIHQELLAFGSNPVRVIVDFHVVFNVLLAFAFLPFTKPLAAFCTILVPAEAVNENDPSRPKYLDSKELDAPSIALSSVMRETLRMADVLQSMMAKSIVALRDNNEALVQEVRNQDDVIDSLFKAVKMYMAKITQDSLDPRESHKYMQILSFASNIENAGDTIDKSLMEMAQKKIEDRKRFSKEGWSEILEIHNFVMETLRLSQSVFVSEDPVQARRIVQAKDDLRLKEKKATNAHMLRIHEGIPDTIATSSLHLDILRDYRRINSYMASVAYAILEEAGELMTSRLKKNETGSEKPVPDVI
ncbi:MAG: na+/Pi-cotransporter family protein [Alphaproteobacteria bacterium CG_4_9_14_3_um_filter_47_13]|nr:MAG: na+/Pi-cotransporter family protein [Alphaproteobacteria bacterium CG_4_9_14_3_um_filter_47_13]